MALFLGCTLDLFWSNWFCMEFILEWLLQFYKNYGKFTNNYQNQHPFIEKIVIFLTTFMKKQMLNLNPINMIHLTSYYQLQEIFYLHHQCAGKINRLRKLFAKAKLLESIIRNETWIWACNMLFIDGFTTFLWCIKWFLLITRRIQRIPRWLFFEQMVQ